jgi:hypothetical protein
MDWKMNTYYAKDSTEYTWYLHAPNAIVIICGPYQTVAVFSHSYE